jgi:hypothetical protein
MKVELMTIKIPVKAWQPLRLIAAHTGEKQYAVVARLLIQELAKLQKGPSHECLE